MRAVTAWVVLLATLGLVTADFPKYSMVLGARVQMLLEWTPDTTTGTVDLCVTIGGNHGNYVAIGFVGSTINHMEGADIVAGLTDGTTGSVKTYYAVNATGYPGGTPTLELTNTEFTETSEGQRMCFTRKIAGGHHPLSDTGNLIWAIGKVVDGGISYHGSDPHHMENDNRTHRSDEVPPIPWLSGPSLPYARTLGPALGLKITWGPTATPKTVRMCLSCLGNHGRWMGIGFAPNPPNHMADTDIVTAFMGASAPMIQVHYALNATGYPAGKPTLVITDQRFEETTSGQTLCFTRSYESGHHPITNDGEVIWAVGPVVSGGISYHGSDPKGEANALRTHRSDEVPVIPWLEGH